MSHFVQLTDYTELGAFPGIESDRPTVSANVYH